MNRSLYSITKTFNPSKIAFEMSRCPTFSVVVEALEKIAPSSLAAKWDNTGVLVDSIVCNSRSSDSGEYNIFFCNDLTYPVLLEAISKKSDVIVTYHPTPFSALKKFQLDNSAAKIILTAAKNNVAIYSPHTAWDSVNNGLNDWLLYGILEEAGLESIEYAPINPLSNDYLKFKEVSIGEGRTSTIVETSISHIVEAIKKHLKLNHVQVSLPERLINEINDGKLSFSSALNSLVGRVSVCAGSGASFLPSIYEGIFVTGEMSHHDLLTASRQGVTVILTNHSNCERGFLRVAAGRLSKELAGSQKQFNFLISETDSDPLVVV